MIVLTSNGLAQPRIYNLILEQANLKPRKACVVVTAVVPEKESAPWVISACKDLLEKGIEQVEIFDFETQDYQLLASFDLIYFMGGNPFALIKHARTPQVHALLSYLHQDGKIIIGRSAGSMLLTSGATYVEAFNDIMGFGNEVRNTVGISDLSGFNFTDQILFPHFDKATQKVEGVEEKIAEIERREEIQIVRLRDGEAYFVDENNRTTFLNCEGKINEVVI